MLTRTDVRFTPQLRAISMRKILIAALLAAIALPALAQTCSREQQEALQSQIDGLEWSIQRNDTSASPASQRAQLRELNHYMETCNDSILRNGH
jgi:Tfp pilus assembly major pilin PilA